MVPSKLPGLGYIYDSGISWLHSIWCPEKAKLRSRILKPLDLNGEGHGKGMAKITRE